MTPLARAFADQAAACTALGSPFTARLCTELPALLPTPLAARLQAWPGDPGPAGASLPLRLAAALHALHLSGDTGLAAIYPPATPDDATFRAAIARALTRHATAIDAFIDRPPQTNEVRRAAVLIALGHWLTARFGLPLVTSEIGASAGLNLRWDRYALALGPDRFGPADAPLTLAPDWTGSLPPATPPRVAERRGVDLTPLDPADPGDRLRLLACLWADQPHRRDLTLAALAAATDPVDRADALDWLPARLAAPRPGHLHLVYSTIAWQYLPPEGRAHGTSLIETAGRCALETAPLAWFRMEADGTAPGAALTLRLWPGDHSLAMGRADFHGRWVTWTTPAPSSGPKYLGG